MDVERTSTGGSDKSNAPARTTIWRWGWISTLAIEGVTILARAVSGMSVTDLHAHVELPLVLKTHHMFWGVALAAITAPLLGRLPRWGPRLLGLGAGLLFSDLMHHFVVLPLWVGNTGWHWP